MELPELPDLSHPSTLLPDATGRIHFPPLERAAVKPRGFIYKSPELLATPQERTLWTVATEIQNAAGHYDMPLPKTVGQRRTDPRYAAFREILNVNNGQVAITNATLTPQEVEKWSAINRAVHDIGPTGSFELSLSDMLRLSFDAKDAASLSDGQAAHMLLRVMNAFTNNMFHDYRVTHPQTLSQCDEFFDSLLSDGKITPEQYTQLKISIEPIKAAYDKIVPLLAEAESMLPAYAAKIDEGALKAGEQERGSR